MFGRLILILIQIAVAWVLADKIISYLSLPPFGQAKIYLYAVIFSLLVWIVGMLGGLVLKDVATPSPSTLGLAFGAAVIFATITLVPDAMAAVGKVIKGVPDKAFPLIGAVLGYAIKR